MMTNSELLNRITTLLELFGGMPIVRDVCESVELLLGPLVQGVGAEEILDNYSGLEKKDIHACTAYPHGVIAAYALNAVSIASR